MNISSLKDSETILSEVRKTLITGQCTHMVPDVWGARHVFAADRGRHRAPVWSLLHCNTVDTLYRLPYEVDNGLRLTYKILILIWVGRLEKYFYINSSDYFMHLEHSF